MHYNRIFLALTLTIFFSGCTAAPMVALMGYDTIGKRGRWIEYAKSGDTYAQYELAQSYCCRPQEGATDAREAMKWWCKAAKNGYAKAQVQLGKIYENQEIFDNLNVPADTARAYMWYKLAYNRANAEAEIEYNRIKPLMNGSQVAQAERLMNNWKAVPCGVGL